MALDAGGDARAPVGCDKYGEEGGLGGKVFTPQAAALLLVLISVLGLEISARGGCWLVSYRLYRFSSKYRRLCQSYIH